MSILYRVRTLFKKFEKFQVKFEFKIKFQFILLNFNKINEITFVLM